MVSEPEAAALYTLKDLREQDGEESINVSLSNRLSIGNRPDNLAGGLLCSL
jgi:hypothetical protein